MTDISLDRVHNFFDKTRELLIALLLAGLLIGSLTTLSMIDRVVLATGYSSIYWFLGLIVINVGAIFSTAYLVHIRRVDRLFLVVTLSALLFYIFVYYIRLSDSDVRLFSIPISTKITATASIVGIYGVTVYYLLRQELLPFFLRASTAFLVLLSTFSLFSFVQVNNSTNTFFTQDTINILINHFNPLPWIFLASIALSFITRAELNLRKIKDELPILLNATGLYFVVLLSLYWLGISNYGLANLYYWQQSFLGFVFWDFIYKYSYKMYDRKLQNNGFRQSWQDLAYYCVLFFLILMSTQVNI